MAAPRATQFIALRNLARAGRSHHHTHQHVRSLHMTGPATYASPVLLQEDTPVTQLPSDIAGLRAECKRRKIDPAGSKHELVSRLRADEVAHSRAFSTAIDRSNRRPSKSNTTTDGNSAPTVRHFNTSRALKAVNDSSTMDFAYLPTSVGSDAEFASGMDDTILRVPILPTNDLSANSPATIEPHVVEEVVMKPEISHVSADAVYLPMAEHSDGHAMNVDFHALADRVANNIRRMRVPVEQQAGLMKQIWNDLVDDIVGAQAQRQRAGASVA